MLSAVFRRRARRPGQHPLRLAVMKRLRFFPKNILFITSSCLLLFAHGLPSRSGTIPVLQRSGTAAGCVVAIVIGRAACEPVSRAAFPSTVGKGGQDVRRTDNKHFEHRRGIAKRKLLRCPFVHLRIGCPKTGNRTGGPEKYAIIVVSFAVFRYTDSRNPNSEKQRNIRIGEDAYE